MPQQRFSYNPRGTYFSLSFCFLILLPLFYEAAIYRNAILQRCFYRLFNVIINLQHWVFIIGTIFYYVSCKLFVEFRIGERIYSLPDTTTTTPKLEAFKGL